MSHVSETAKGAAHELSYHTSLNEDSISTTAFTRWLVRTAHVYCYARRETDLRLDRAQCQAVDRLLKGQLAERGINRRGSVQRACKTTTFVPPQVWSMSRLDSRPDRK